MAVESGLRTPGWALFIRRGRERVSVWRRIFIQNWNLFKASRIGVVGLAIMIAFVILALAAPFMGLRDPIRWTAPDEDLIAVDVFWAKESTAAGSELRTAPAVNQPVAFRVFPRNFDARADRIYVAAGNRLYAILTQPDLRGQNAWGTTFYFDTAADGANRTISVPPLVMNYGAYGEIVPDYEVYVGTSDGTLFLLRDTGVSVPSGGSVVARLNALNGSLTGLAAYNGDMDAPPSILGAANHAFLNGSAWVSGELPGAGDVGEFTSLALNASGGAYIAYYDLTNGLPRVAARVRSAWVPLNVDEPVSAAENVGLYTSLAIGTDDRPRLAYYDETEGNLKYAEWNGTLFNSTLVESIGDVGRSASLALEPGTNWPRIAYYNATEGSLRFTSWDGANWSFETVDGGGVGRYASLALGPTGEPHVAYYDSVNSTVKHAAKIGPTWVSEVVDVVGDPAFAVVGGIDARPISIAVDAAGMPHVAYYDATAGDLRYATTVAGSWTPQTVDGSGDVGRYPSLAFAPSGRPAIAYEDATSFDLKYARLNATSLAWDSETVLSEGQVGLYNSLSFNATGSPHIAFYSFATGRTTRDMIVAGTSTGKLYGVDVGIPSNIQRAFRSKMVFRWEYRIRWTADLGSEIHLAAAPFRSITDVPLFSPAFSADGSVVYVGTKAGRLWALNTTDGTSHWRDLANAPRFVNVGGPWKSAPVVQTAAEGPVDVDKHEIVYAGSSRIVHDFDGDGDVEEQSLLIARFATNGEPLRQWSDAFKFRDFEGAAPVGPAPPGLNALTTPDGGDLTQPSVEGGTIYVGSTSGWFYAFRRDRTGELPEASLKWKYRDLALLGLKPMFTSPAAFISAKGILLTAANHNNGTDDPSDDRGVLYSLKPDIGNLSWKKTFLSVIPGLPAVWTPPASLDYTVWVAYGGRAVAGVQALRATGQFLAPSPPSWAHRYACGEGATCPGYPSGNQYWLGLDSQGRDIFSQVIWGSRIALLVGFLSAFFTVVLGVIVGLIAGYVGGKTESVLMRFTDVILVLPGLPLIITLAAVLGASIWNIILVISLLGWPGIARIIRAEVLSLKERPFIDSARVTGASTTRIVFRHIAPNVMPLAFLYMTFAVSGAILTEAALSFIGLGDITTMSWGIMLQLMSQSKALTALWWLLPPGLAITLISLSFFLVGRAFDEIVNPRLRKR